MPPYATSGTASATPNLVAPTVLYPGDDKYLFGTSVAAGVSPTPGQIQAPNDSNVVSEAVTVGERSIAICLAPRPGGGAPPGLMVQAFASANPGAAEIDIQDAAVDADGAYLTPTGSATYKLTAWTQLGASAIWTAWAEFQPEGGAFITAKVIANPNGVSFTLKARYV